MQCFTLTPKWPPMLLDFNLLWFLIFDYLRCFWHRRLPYRSIFTSFASATQQKKYIYEHKADFYFNKVPLHAAVCFLFPLFGQSKVFCRSCHYLWRTAVWLSWSLSKTRTVCEWFPVCLFGCVSFCFSVYGLRLAYDIQWRGWGRDTEETLCIWRIGE